VPNAFFRLSLLQQDGKSRRVVGGDSARRVFGRWGKVTMDKSELQKVETYLRRTFSNAAIRVVARPKKKDSAEVYIGDEFIGVVSEDNEDGDKSYFFEMAILDTDLE
jgi:hypothetical protein